MCTTLCNSFVILYRTQYFSSLRMAPPPVAGRARRSTERRRRRREQEGTTLAGARGCARLAAAGAAVERESEGEEEEPRPQQDRNVRGAAPAFPAGEVVVR